MTKSRLIIMSIYGVYYLQDESIEFESLMLYFK